MDRSQWLDAQRPDPPLARDLEAAAQSHLDPFNAPGRVQGQVVDDRQEAERVAISNMDAARKGGLGLPGSGHDADRVLAGLEDSRRGTESEPGILLQDETLNWKWGPVVRRNSHPTPLAGR